MSEDFRAVQVLKEAIAHNRLPHGILLNGANLKGLESIALSLSQILLETDQPASKHPDFHSLRPSNKMRQIGADETRALTQEIYKAPFASKKKVAIVYDADRMNITAANAFLKTLEEPPADTTLFLLTTKPHGLLPTIRSRCFLFKLPLKPEPIISDNWLNWIEDYKSWISSTQVSPLNADKRSALIMGLYGLIYRLEKLIKELTAEAEEQIDLPNNISDEQKVALTTGNYKSMRQKVLSAIEESTRDYVLQDSNDRKLFLKLAQVVAELEKVQGLLETNLNESTALEVFFLESLRIWTAKG